MRSVLLSLLFATCSVWLAFAGPCTGAETQLAQVSRALTVNSLATAENTLHALSLSYPDCPEIVLHQARLSQAKGNPSQAAELYYRYTDTDPNDSRGLAYFGRFFLEQRDYMRADALSAAAVDKNPDDPAAMALRGQVSRPKGKPCWRQPSGLTPRIPRRNSSWAQSMTRRRLLRELSNTFGKLQR